jgi:hypothetical protein
MKKMIIFLLVFIALKSQAQHYDIPVTELTPGDTTFYKHPVALHVDFVRLNGTFDTCIYNITTQYVAETLAPGMLSKSTIMILTPLQ